MNLAAMIDLGVDKEYLSGELDKLNVSGYKIEIKNGLKQGISGTQVFVHLEHQHGEHGHKDHNHHHQHHHHENRNLEDIRKIILNSGLNENVKNLSLKMFQKIAEAEAKIHNKTINEVHFHEVGAIDSIVDIVGAAICIDYLKPDKIISSSVELGGGFVTCAHGTFPVPAPATVEILKGIPVKSGVVKHETTTPTGAAILATISDEFTDNTGFTIQKTGYGIGHKDFSIPNVLRVYLGEGEPVAKTTVKSAIIECNIDDMNPEFYDYVFEMLFKAGASDVFITPVIMKKSRPAVTLSVLCTSETEQQVEKILFEETSTLGIRKHYVNKTMLDRKTENIDTPYGKVRVKYAFYNGRFLKSKPEYEDCLTIAREKKLPIGEVYKKVSEFILKTGNHNA